ncbi:MAG: pseudouridine synthase [Terriglobia bacterium]
MQERLQKIIAAAGVTSRRKAEEMILQGLVSVNGHTVTELGTKADAERDHIRVSGRMLQRGKERITLLLNKPDGVVSTVSDPEGRLTVVSLLQKLGIKDRVYPVGRLDYHSTGLILMTNDGELANHLMSRATGAPRSYHVKLQGAPSPFDLKKLESGIALDGQRTSPAVIRPLGERTGRDKPWYEITLVEGRYHQVRRMFERIGQPVVKLKRVRIAFLTVSGLSMGHARRLTAEEVDRLRNWHPGSEGAKTKPQRHQDPKASKKVKWQKAKFKNPASWS